MTSVTTMLGVMPMMIGLGAGSGLQRPLAVAVFGGLFTSTVLTLIVIPVVYEMVEDARTWLTRDRSTAIEKDRHPAGSAGLASGD
jgi:HAE1 family hydrophobic/amphiphilic exporter-1